MRSTHRRRLPEVGDVGRDLGDVGPVAAVAHRQGKAPRARRRRHRRVRAELRAAFCTSTRRFTPARPDSPNSTSFSRRSMKVRLAAPVRAPHRLRRDARSAGRSRRAGDRSASPSCVPLVKNTPRSSTCWSKRVDDEHVGRPTRASASRERRHLLREREDLRAAPDVALLFEAREQPLVEPRRSSASNSAGNASARRPLQRLLVRERDAPDLRAALLREVVEVLGEAGDQVALGHHHVHRQLDAAARLFSSFRRAARRRDVRLARRPGRCVIRSWALIVEHARR